MPVSLYTPTKCEISFIISLNTVWRLSSFVVPQHSLRLLPFPPKGWPVWKVGYQWLTRGGTFPGVRWLVSPSQPLQLCLCWTIRTSGQSTHLDNPHISWAGFLPLKMLGGQRPCARRARPAPASSLLLWIRGLQKGCRYKILILRPK